MKIPLCDRCEKPCKQKKPANVVFCPFFEKGYADAVKQAKVAGRGKRTLNNESWGGNRITKRGKM